MYKGHDSIIDTEAVKEKENNQKIGHNEGRDGLKGKEVNGGEERDKEEKGLIKDGERRARRKKDRMPCTIVGNIMKPWTITDGVT